MSRKRKPEHVLRTLSSFNFDKIVGSGTFGVVFKAVEKETEDRVALKKIKMEKQHQGFPITAIREIKILKALKHENVVSLKEMIIYDSDQDKDIVESSGLVHGDIFMVFEFCDFDLSGLLRSPKVILTEHHIKSYMKQLLYGITYIHTNKILHRDIKGANILITRNNVLKIADWGLARSYYSTDQKFTNPVVTQWYRSPELLLGSTQYNNEIDIWSIGCLFAEMKSATKVPLLPGKDDITQLDMIYQLQGTPTGEVEEYYKKLPNWDKMTISKTYPPSLYKRLGHQFDNNTMYLLSRLLDMHPSKRISAAAALDTEYFWNNPAPPPEQLPVFDVDAAFALSEDERMREEYRKREEEKRLAAESRSTGSGDTGRGGRGGGRLAGRGVPGRGRLAYGPSKFAVSKPPTRPPTSSTAVSSSVTATSIQSEGISATQIQSTHTEMSEYKQEL